MESENSVRFQAASLDRVFDIWSHGGWGTHYLEFGLSGNPEAISVWRELGRQIDTTGVKEIPDIAIEKDVVTHDD